MEFIIGSSYNHAFRQATFTGISNVQTQF